MIKVHIIALGIALTTCLTIHGQPGYGAYSLVDEGIFPSNPTSHDSVIVPLQIFFSATGAQKKFGSTLCISGDTVLYSGCYYCGCFESYWYIEPDTVAISPLPIGLYHLIIIARYASTYQDTFCFSSDQALYDTIDTFFTVSPPNATETLSAIPFYAVLENFNTLQINVAGSGTLGVEVYDALGKQVFNNSKIDVQQGNNNVNLRIPVLSPGIYFYHLTVGDKEKVLKYMIM